MFASTRRKLVVLFTVALHCCCLVSAIVLIVLVPHYRRRHCVTDGATEVKVMLQVPFAEELAFAGQGNLAALSRCASAVQYRDRVAALAQRADVDDCMVGAWARALLSAAVSRRRDAARGGSRCPSAY